MKLFDGRFTLNYLWSLLVSAFFIFLLFFVFRGFRGDFSKRFPYVVPQQMNLTLLDTSQVLTILQQGESVEVIAVDFANRSFALVESESGYRGWIRSDDIDCKVVIKTKAVSTFSSKRFEKAVLGKTLQQLENEYAEALSVRPVFGRNFEALFPFRVYDRKGGTATESVKVMFIDGVATSYNMEPAAMGQWKNNNFFPLVQVMTGMGWAASAPQSDILFKLGGSLAFRAYKDFPDTFWGGMLKIIVLIFVAFIAIAFLGMIPYCLEKFILDVLRFSPSVSMVAGVIWVIVLNTVFYYFMLSVLFMWIGFSWVGLAAGVLGWLRVMIPSMPLLTCAGYVTLMRAKCEKCNHTKSYEKVGKKVLSSVPYNEKAHSDLFKPVTRRHRRRKRAESIFMEDIAPRGNEGVQGGFVEEYEYTFKCKYCSNLVTTKVSNWVLTRTETEAPSESQSGDAAKSASGDAAKSASNDAAKSASDATAGPTEDIPGGSEQSGV